MGTVIHWQPPRVGDISHLWPGVHSWVPQPGTRVPNSMWGLSIESKAAQLSLGHFQALLGPFFTSLSFSSFLALCWIPAALRSPVFCAAGIKPSAFVAPESLDGTLQLEILHFCTCLCCLELLLPQAALLGRECWTGQEPPHGYQAVGKARCRRGWRSCSGRTRTKEPALSTGAKRQRIRLLRDLANSLEHWGLAGTHPSLHERVSVFHSSKQLMG